ncbi:MAG: polysaccharide biosynthesis/export family protein [Alistipes sp.]|nr:polysaccharide biosynthesis/export family protein [Alistipes sp.]
MKSILRATVLMAVVFLASCSAEKKAWKKAWYIQDAQFETVDRILQNGQIRIKPLDRLTIMVNSRNPELAVPFNSWSSYSSLSGTQTAGSTGASSLQIRTVDERGMLGMPIIGEIEAQGKTRSELSQAIADKIAAAGYINDASVNVEFADMKISVLGEVERPGYFDVTRDKVTIFDALAMAGDMTVYAVREEVIVEREENGQRTFYTIDLTSTKSFDSPVYYLQQNDIIYVKPNRYKAQTGRISQNRNFYLSLIATAISITTLIVTITK